MAGRLCDNSCDIRTEVGENRNGNGKNSNNQHNILRSFRLNTGNAIMGLR